MAKRTDAETVKLVLSTSLSDPQIEQFITDASLWVDEELTGLTFVSLSDNRLELVERYLTCALIRLRDMGLSSASWDDVRESYQVDSQVTDYLLRAASMDPSGKVRKMFLAPKSTRVARTWRGQTFKEEFREPLSVDDG